jgi:hypothetical protein
MHHVRYVPLMQWRLFAAYIICGGCTLWYGASQTPRFCIDLTNCTSSFVQLSLHLITTPYNSNPTVHLPTCLANPVVPPLPVDPPPQRRPLGLKSFLHNLNMAVKPLPPPSLVLERSNLRLRHSKARGQVSSARWLQPQRKCPLTQTLHPAPFIPHHIHNLLTHPQ